MSLDQVRAYRPLSASEVRLVRVTVDGAVQHSLFVIESPYGYRRVAKLTRPAEVRGPSPAVLFAHWYEPESPTSNRSQFEDEANQLSASGATCLLVETLWSDPDFFMKRTQADDRRASLEESVNLRRLIDFLVSQTDVDGTRVAVVGHDFGGMYLALAGAMDRRPTHYVIMAATPRFSDWYLYHPQLEGAEREAFIADMADLDPVSHIASLAPCPVLFQFGTNDPHVPAERAQEFFGAAAQPKSVRWYESGHGLNDAATRDRALWLSDQLHLPQGRPPSA